MSRQEQEQQRPLQVFHMGPRMTIDNAVALRDRLLELIEQGEDRDIALDLDGVTEADASGLGALVAAFSAGSRRGRKVFLYRPTEHIRHLLEQLDISGFFPLIASPSDLIVRLPD